MQFLNNDRLTFHLSANVLLFKWGAFFSHFPQPATPPPSLPPPSLIQSSEVTLEWNMAIITFYLGWARLLALTFPLLLGNDGWLLGERLADWRIGGRVGCCCKGRTSVEFFTSPFSYLTQQNSNHYSIVHLRPLDIA